jgi:hypothetical protein
MSPIENDSPRESGICIFCKFCISSNNNDTGLTFLVCTKEQNMSIYPCPLFRED